MGEWGGLSGGCCLPPQHWGGGEQWRQGETLLNLWECEFLSQHQSAEILRHSAGGVRMYHSQ